MGRNKGCVPWNKGLRGEGTSFYGKTHSEETKNRMSKNSKGEHRSPSTEFKKGHKMSQETIYKLSEFQKNNDNSGRFRKGHIPVNHFEMGHIPWNKDVKKQTNTGATHFKKNHEPWNKGKIFEEMVGENHWNWRGGISDKGYAAEWTNELRETVRRRDNHMCQKCGITQDEVDWKLSVHHIDSDKTNNNIDNLITYCIPCHIKLHVSDSRGKGSLQKVDDDID